VLWIVSSGPMNNVEVYADNYLEAFFKALKKRSPKGLGVITKFKIKHRRENRFCSTEAMLKKLGLMEQEDEHTFCAT